MDVDKIKALPRDTKVKKAQREAKGVVDAVQRNQ